MKSLRVLSLILLVSPLQAAFQWKHDSVRSASLGGAVAASPSGAGDLFGNPASLGGLNNLEISLLYSRPYSGLPDIGLSAGSGAFAIPTRLGTLGLGIGTFQASGSKEETTLALSYGVALPGKAQAGVSIKNLRHRYLIGGDARAKADPVFKNGDGKSAWGIDAGVTARIGMVRVGLTARNLNEPDLGLATEDKVMREVQTGAALEMKGLGLTLTGDLSYGKDAFGKSEGGMKGIFGVEQRLAKDRLALRAGANPREFTAGFGIGLGSLKLDYGMVFHRALSEDNSGTHRAQLTYRFTRGGK